MMTRQSSLSTMLLLCLSLGTLWVSSAGAHHVLCVLPVPSRSHDHLAAGVVRALLDAGHQVTWGTPFPNKPARQNLTIIDLSVTKAIGDALDMTDSKNRDAGMGLVKQFSRNISSATVQVPALREALVSQQFDAVVTEWFFSDVDAGYAAVQQVPWILLSGVNIHPLVEMLVDDVRTVATHPLMMNDFAIPMNLWERLVNTAVTVLMGADFWLSFSSNEDFYRTNFGPLAEARGAPLPAFSEVLYNVSVMLVNSHPSVVPAQSLPPNVVSIGGYHIEQNPPPLPKDLQDLLDASPQGVVYFSMGSVIKTAALPARTQQALLRVLGGLKQTVLWKFEEQLENVPENVHVRAWMPQASILAHPNVKLFITHGGLLSTLEAAHYGVPLLAIPVFGDQPGNAARSVRAGVARMVAFSPNMAEMVKVELNEMLGNEKYFLKAKAVSKLFRNRPILPGKLIAHYIEVAIESKGAYHLRSPAMLYSWYQLWMLDQIGILLLALYILYVLLKKAVSCVKGAFGTSKKQKKS